MKLPDGTGVTPVELFELFVGFELTDPEGFSDASFFTLRLVADDDSPSLPVDREFDFFGDPFTFPR